MKGSTSSALTLFLFHPRGALILIQIPRVPLRSPGLVRLWRERPNLIMKGSSRTPPNRLNTRPTCPTADYFGQQLSSCQTPIGHTICYEYRKDCVGNRRQPRNRQRNRAPACE